MAQEHGAFARGLAGVQYNSPSLHQPYCARLRVEPTYSYGLSKPDERSIGVATGLIIAIP
jgi:hypothetical protein